MIELNIQLYFKLLHAMLRGSSDPEEAARARDVMVWVSENTTDLQRVMNAEDRRLMAAVLIHWESLREAPSLTALDSLVRKQDQSKGMETLLDGYREHLPHLPHIDAIDVRVVFNDRKEDWEKYQFVTAMQDAHIIATQGIDGAKKSDPPRKGVKDAHRFLIEKFQDGIITGGRGVSGGSIADTAGTLASMYGKIKEQANDGKLVIRTGISVIDDTCIGLYRGTLNLILGFTGQRKSAVARTIGYNACLQGFRVLFIPLEMSAEEELQFISMMHATNGDFFEGTESYSITRFQNGRLHHEEETFLAMTVIPDMQRHIGTKMAILKPKDKTWASIRSLIELENFKNPLDMVIIDYLSLTDTKGERDRTAAINEVAIQAKALSAELENGRAVWRS